MSKDILIQIRDLNKSFPLIKFPKNIIDKSKKNVIKDLNLDIYKGDKIAIIGHNGIGKSTLINLILGYLPLDKGKIYYSGYDNFENFLSNTGILFQKTNYLKESTPSRILDIILDLNFTRDENLSYKKWRKEVAIPLKNKMVELFQIEDCLKKQIKKLSGGEQQKLNLIISLIKRPEILILDEFTTGLDMTFKFKIIKYIKDYCKENNVTLIIVSHIEEEISSLAERVVLIDEKSVVNDFTISDLKKEKIDLNIYLEQYFREGIINEKLLVNKIEEISKNSFESSKDNFKFKLLDKKVKSKNTTSFLDTVERDNKANIDVQEKKLEINNSYRGYWKLLFSDWFKTGGWVFPLLYFFIGIFVTTIGYRLIYNDPSKGDFVTYDNLQTIFSYSGSLSVGIAAYTLVGIWGYLLFKVRSTSMIKRIKLSISDKNSFITFAIFMSFFWFFVPLLISIALIAILNSAGVLLPFDDSLTIFLNDGTKTTFGVIKNQFTLKNVNWGMYIYSALLSWALFTSIIFIILRFVKVSQSIYFFSTITLVVIFGMFGMFTTPSFNIEGLNTNDYSTVISNLQLGLVIGTPLNLSASSFAQASANFDNNWSSWQMIYSSLITLVIIVPSMYFGLKGTYNWTDN